MREVQYTEPNTIKEAKAKLRELEVDIAGIERSLSETERTNFNEHRPMTKAEFKKWRGSALSSRMFKKLEYTFLKGWIKERRRRINASDLDVFSPDDPRSLLIGARAAIRRALDGNTSDLGTLYNVIDEYLNHAA